MPFNSKLWSARQNPSFTVLDGDASVSAYLVQFAHKEKSCGGAPEKGHYEIICSVCKKRWPWMKGALGEIIAQLPFKSLVLK